MLVALARYLFTKFDSLTHRLIHQSVKVDDILRVLYSYLTWWERSLRLKLPPPVSLSKTPLAVQPSRHSLSFDPGPTSMS